MEKHNKSKIYELTGVVLAGGLSSRLGKDKAALMLDGEEDLLLRSVRLLLGVSSKVLVVGRDAPGLNDMPGVECIRDEQPGCGPVGGIAAALKHSGTDCLVLSCDLPFMTATTLQGLINAWNRRKADTLLYAYSQQGTGKIENLVGIYSRNALDIIQNSLNKKLLKISLVLPKEQQEMLEYGLEDSLPFFNINYPADLFIAREYLRLQKKNDF